MTAEQRTAPVDPAEPSLRHVLGRLALLEAGVRAAVTARRQADPKPDDAFRGLYLSDRYIDALLDRRPTGPAGRTDPLADLVEAAADEAEAAGHHVRLRGLAQKFGLSAGDVDALLVAAAPDLDPRFEKLYGYLHDDVSLRRASVGLAIQLSGGSPLDHEARGRFDPDAPLRSGGLLAVEEPAKPFLTRPLRVPDRVTAYLLGNTALDPALHGALRRPMALDSAEGARISRAWAAGVRVVYCKQPPGDWTAAVVAAQDPMAIVLDISYLSGTDISGALHSAIRDARMLDRTLVAGPIDGVEPAVLRQLTGSGARVVLHGAGAWDPGWATTGVLGLDLLTLARRQVPPELRARVTDRPLALAAFRLSPDQVRRSISAAESLAAADGVQPGDEHLRAGARMQNATGLGRLARRVEPAATWSDLVLPPMPLAQLRHLTDRLRWRERVLGDWQLRRAGGRGEGVTVLFAGEPGTGKTMAAEVIAADLGLDLYVIDLSTVVDKYIGETEKNLERVFSGAEGVNGVLFFDEADALFGKRSEVSDARDRYANLEVAYLLQRMESFDGLAVLATNLKANLDPGFARRLSLIVEFSRPDVKERRQLWQQALASVPLGDDVDLDFCAEAFELAGGDIRNIAVTAAYLAAADSGVADMRWLVRAVRVEYRKLGRLCVEAEFGRYFPLLTNDSLATKPPPHAPMPSVAS